MYQKGELSDDADISAKIGYMFQVKEVFGISVLGELGYSWDLYMMGYGDTSVSSITGAGNTTYIAKDGMDFSQYYHSFKIWLLPKFNIGVERGAIALGIDGGVKIPLAGKQSLTVTIPGDSHATSEYAKTQTYIDLKRKDITDMFSHAIIGYMKFTFDYYLFFTDNIAMNFGLYLGGDFGLKQKEVKIGADAFDFGLQLGFRFGPKA